MRCPPSLDNPMSPLLFHDENPPDWLVQLVHFYPRYLTEVYSGITPLRCSDFRHFNLPIDTSLHAGFSLFEGFIGRCVTRRAETKGGAQVNHRSSEGIVIRKTLSKRELM